MARWTWVARWVGPTPNQDATRSSKTRGLVVHIAEGTFNGTISWQRNPTAKVSSHFIISRGGEIVQMVDTDAKAWAQKAGNAEWLSIECEGFTTASPYYRPGWEVLSAQQIEAIATLLVYANKVHGVPLQLASGPDGAGLGYHSMGGTAWGHLDCPGAPIIGQRGVIVERAKMMVAAPPSPSIPGVTPFPLAFPPNYFGLRSGPSNSHGGARAIDRPFIRQIQGRLEALGFYTGKVDSDYGSLTEAAVYAFQRARGLQVDGRVGPETWKALFS